MKHQLFIVFVLVVLTFGFSQSANCQSSENSLKPELVFIYVHGFGELKQVVPFEEKMQEFLQRLPLNSQVITYRWDWVKVDLTKVVAQWTEAKVKANHEAQNFMHDVILKYEAEQTPYVLVGYSLGTRVIAESLKYGTSPLQYLRGIYFLGSALPHDYTLRTDILPESMKIISYYSEDLDYILKFCFSNAEGTQAGGEIGFDDKAVFQNYRTVSTHLHKGGPIQRDWSNFAPAIAYLAFFHEKIFINGEKPNFNIEMPVASGSLHWNDLLTFETETDTILIQQNANTDHYRTTALTADGKRTRQAWGNNLHTILQELQLFSGPYKKMIHIQESVDQKIP